MIHPSFRSLASTVREFVEQGSRKLVITSAAPGEGKSTITAQLGKALVRSSGQSVILVDTDPFRSCLSWYFSACSYSRGCIAPTLLQYYSSLDCSWQPPVWPCCLSCWYSMAALA